MNTIISIPISGANRLRPFMMKSVIIVMSLSFLSSIANAKSEKEWTGFYGGFNAGVIFNAADIDSNNLGFSSPDGTCNTSSYFASVFPGVQLGYAQQFNAKIVLGMEADFTYNFNKVDRQNCACVTSSDVFDQYVIMNRQQASLRGRIGYALDSHILPFLTAGGSLASLGLNYRNETSDYYSTSSTRPGWLVGAGLEWYYTSTWSIRAEYFYTAYHNAFDMKIPSIYGLSDPNGRARVDMSDNNIRVAINYWI